MMALFSVLLLVASVQVAICKPYDLVVTDVGSNSAIIHWKTTETSTTIENFRILCNGTRHYVSMDGEHLLDTDEKLQYAPSGVENVRIGDLQENFNYSCTIQEGIPSQLPILYGEPSDPCYFSTDYGDPEQPKTPEIQISQRRHSIKISLFSTSTRFGPISGYQVQFHLVKSKTSDGLVLIDDDAYNPNLPSSRLVSKSEAQLSIEAKSFWLDFENGMLPANIVIGQKLLQGALKNGREYTVATVPYTVYTKQSKSVLLFTPSNLSAIFKTWSFSSPNTAVLDTSDPAELALIIALGVGLPLFLLGYLACFGVVIYCIVRRRRKKRMRKEYSRRDVIQALALRRAQQLGIELPWYNQQTTDENQGDLPWLDPFSAAQPRMVPYVSSSSQSGLDQLETSGSHAQPPDPCSPVMLNDGVSMDAPPVFSETDLTRQDVGSAAAQHSEAISLVASALNKAMLVVSGLMAPELAGQDISSTAAQMSNDTELIECALNDNQMDCETLSAHWFVEEAAEMMNKHDNHDLAMQATLSTDGPHSSLCSSTSSSSNDCHISYSQDRTPSLIGSEHLSLHQVGLTEQCVYSSCKCDDCDLGEDRPLPEEVSLEVDESFYSSKTSNSEEESSYQLEDNTVKSASADQCAKSNDCDNHSTDDSGTGNNCDLSENKPLSQKASLEVEESFYSSKSSNDEEQSGSEIHDNNTVQSVNCKQLKVDSSKISKIDDQSSSHICQDSLQFISCDHLRLHHVASATQCVHTVPISSDYDDHDLSENKSQPQETSLGADKSLYDSKTSNSEEESSSNFNQLEDSTVQLADCEQMSIASADQCTKSNDHNGHSTGDSGAEIQLPGDTALKHHHSIAVDSDIQNSTDLVELVLPLKEASLEVNSLRIRKIDDESSSDFSQNRTQSLIGSEHMSLHRVGMTEQCMFNSYKCDDCDLGEEKASLEVKESFYSSKSSNSDEQSASEFHNGSTVRTTECKQLTPQHVAPADQDDDHSTSELGVEKSLEGAATQEVKHPLSDQSNNDLVELPPPGLEDTSLEVNSSRINTTDNQCSLDFCQGGLQSIACGHVSLNHVASAAQCVHTVPISREANELHYNSKTSNSDKESSSLEDNNVQSSYFEQLSIASTDQCAKLVDYDDHSADGSGTENDYDLGENNPLPKEPSLEVEESFYSSKSINNEEQSASEIHNNSTVQSISYKQLKVDSSKISKIDDQSSSHICQDYLQSISCEHLCLHHVASATQCVRTVPISSDCDDHDLSENKSQPQETSLGADKPLYDSKTSNSEEESSSNFNQLEDSTVQLADCEQMSIASADQCTKSNDHNGHSTGDSGAEIHLPGDTALKPHHSIAVDSDVQNNTDLIELVLPLKEASLEVNSLRIRKIDDESSSDFSQDRTQSLIGSEHLSLHQVGSTEQCMFTSSQCNERDLGEEKAFLEVEESFYSSKSSNSDKQSASELHDDSTVWTTKLSPRHVASADQYVDQSASELGAEKSLGGAAAQEVNHPLSDQSNNNLVELPPPGLEGASLEVNSSRISTTDDPCSSDFYQGGLQSIACGHHSLHQVASAAQCVHTVSISSNCDDHDLNENKSQPGEASLEANESLYSSKRSNSGEESSSGFHQLEDNNVQSADCKLLSIASAGQCAKSNDYDNHSIDGSGAENNCDLGENNPLPNGASLELEESFYSSKSSNSEEEHPSDKIYQLEINTVLAANCEQLSAQFVASANQCAISNDCEDHCADNLEAEKPLPGDTVLEHHSVSINSDVQNSTDLVELVLPLKEASLEVNSLRIRKIDDESSSDFSQDRTQSLIGSEHLSLHQIGSTEQCMFTSSDRDLGEEKALDVDESFYSSKSSNSDKQSASEFHDGSTAWTMECKQLTPQHVASADQDDHSTTEKPLEGAATQELNHPVCDHNSNYLPPPGLTSLEMNSSRINTIDDQCSLDFCQGSLQSTACEHHSLHQVASAAQCMHTVHISSNCEDHDSSENKSQSGGTSLEADELFYSAKTSNSEEESSSGFHQLEDNTVQSASCKQLSIASADQCAKSNDCDNHSTDSSGAENDCELGENNPLPKGALLEVEESFYSSKSSNSEEEHPSDKIYQLEVNTILAANCEQLSAQFVASADKCTKSNDCDDHFTDNLGAGKPLPGDTVLEHHSVSTDSDVQNSTDLVELVLPLKEASLEVNSLRIRKIDDESSSDFSQDRIRSLIGSEHLSLHQMKGLTEQCMFTNSKCDDRDLGEEKGSLDVVESFYSFKSSNNDEQSAPEIHDGSTVWTNECKQLSPQHVASADQYDDQSTSELGAEKSLGGAATQEVNHPLSDQNNNYLPPPGLTSLEVNSSRISTIDDQCSLDFCQGGLQSTACEHHSLHQVASAAQCVHTVPISTNCDDHDLSENKLQHGEASLETNELLYSSKRSNSEEESSSYFHQLEDNTFQSASCKQLSIASADQCAKSNDCDDHSTDDLGAENNCDLGEKEPLSEEASIEMEESFYSSKSSKDKEQGASQFHNDSTVQSVNCKQLSVASANQCATSNDCDHHSIDNNSRTEKQPSGDASLGLHNSISVDSDVRNYTDLVERIPSIGLEDTSLKVNSLRTSKIIDSENSSDYFQGSIQSMDEHLSLHQVASSAQCVHAVSWLSDSCGLKEDKNLPEEASLEVDESCYSSKPNNSEEESSSDVCQGSTNCENLSPHHVASTASFMSDKLSKFDGCTTCDVDEIIAASLEFKQMVYDSRSSTCRIRHIYTNYNLAEYKPLLEDCSLEVNISSYSFKTSRSDSPSRSEFHDNSISHQDSTPSVDSDHLTLHQVASTAQCIMHSSSKSTSSDKCNSCDLDGKNSLPGDASLDVDCSFHTSRTSHSDDLHIQSDHEHLSSHHGAAADYYMSSSCRSSNHDVHSTEDLGIEKPLSGNIPLKLNYLWSVKSDNCNIKILSEDASLTVDQSFHTSRTSHSDNSDNCNSPNFIQNVSMSNPQGVPSASQCNSKSRDVDNHSNKSGDSSTVKPLPGHTSFLDVNNTSDCDFRCMSGEASLDSDLNDQSSSDYITRSFACERLSLHQVASVETDYFTALSSQSSSEQGQMGTQSDHVGNILSSGEEVRIVMEIDEDPSLDSSSASSDHVGMVISSGEEVKIVMEIDEDPSLDSSSASSDHVGMVISSGEEVKIIMEIDEDPSLDSSSTSSFPRDVSMHNIMESKSSSLRNESFHSVLMQLSGSSSSEEERPYEPSHPPPIYEPY